MTFLEFLRLTIPLQKIKKEKNYEILFNLMKVEGKNYILSKKLKKYILKILKQN